MARFKKTATRFYPAKRKTTRTYRRKPFRYNGIPAARRALRFAAGTFERKYEDTFDGGTIPQYEVQTSGGGLNFAHPAYQSVAGIIANGTLINQRVGNVIKPVYLELRYNATACVNNSVNDNENAANPMYGSVAGTTTSGTGSVATTPLSIGNRYARTLFRLVLVQDYEGINASGELTINDVFDYIDDVGVQNAPRNVENLSRLRVLKDWKIELDGTVPSKSGKLYMPLSAPIRFNGASNGNLVRHTNGIVLLVAAFCPDRSASLPSNNRPEFYYHSRLCFTDS